VTPWVKLFPWTNFHEKHSVIYNLSTSKLKFTPPHRFSRSGHSTTVNNDRHQSTPPRPGYSMSFYRLSDQLTCNNISLMALQPKQREWHLAIFSRHIPSLCHKIWKRWASTGSKLIICICLTPFSSWAPSVRGIWMSQWYQRRWKHLRIMQIKFVSCTHGNRSWSYFYLKKLQKCNWLRTSIATKAPL